MKFVYLLILFNLGIVCSALAQSAQVDSVIQQLNKVSGKHINEVDKKIDKYSNRITNKTEKTLVKLARWENKIKELLQKVNPEAANLLFSNTELTFTGLLEKFKEGNLAIANYKSKYDEYRDKLQTSFKYIKTQNEFVNNKIIKSAENINKKLAKLDEDLKSQAYIEDFIRKRKKMLVETAFKYIGKSKIITQLNKESYYYIECIRNYKQLFSDKNKREELALKVINDIPAFKNFMSKNSMLAQLFNMPANYGSLESLNGLQTRASVNNILQSRLSVGGSGAQQQFTQNIQAAQSELSSIKNQLLDKVKAGASPDGEMPDFKNKNDQKSKTFFQRIELGTNIGFSKAQNFFPNRTDIALSAGYKINDKSIIGIGCSYVAGLGTVENIKLTHLGLGLRSFLDWKLKKGFYASGGFEMNYLSNNSDNIQLKKSANWQQSGLIGISKKINIKTKWFKTSKASILYDLLAHKHSPNTQPIVFRMGYSF